MSEEVQVILINCIRKAITLICFTILAIVFQTWWIVLIALIFGGNIGINDDTEEGWIDDK